MKRILFAALAAASLVMASASAADLSLSGAQRTALVVTGIFGEILAPLKEYDRALAKAGYRVTHRTWLNPPVNCFDVAVGHSAGADAVLRSCAKRKFTIDPTLANIGCISGKCLNWYAPEDAIPLVICCGGYQVRNAKNIRVKPGHVGMPGRIAGQVMREILSR